MGRAASAEGCVGLVPGPVWLAGSCRAALGHCWPLAERRADEGGWRKEGGSGRMHVQDGEATEGQRTGLGQGMTGGKKVEVQGAPSVCPGHWTARYVCASLEMAEEDHHPLQPCASCQLEGPLMATPMS